MRHLRLPLVIALLLTAQSEVVGAHSVRPILPGAAVARPTLPRWYRAHAVRPYDLATQLSPPSSGRDEIGRNIARAAASQVGVTTIYDPSYVRLSYPGGDLPLQRGVCADVVVRALRKVGVDLQAELHRDMPASFSEYPKIWRLKRPDRNIDHRRVPNLMRYFTRKGKSLPARSSFQPGDIVAWRLPNNLYHIGIVDTEKVRGTSRYSMIHNIGAGAQREDILNSFPIIGHYRWSGER